MSVPEKLDNTANDIAEAVFVKGDFSNFSPQDKAKYLIEVCRSLGLNPLTRPIEFIRLNGKDVPYAKRDCADQLRKLNGISISVVGKEERDGLLFVHVRAVDKTGREDEDFGAVPMNETIKGEARANAFLKAVTKAKRRVTLSISGLGFLDETEVDSAQSTTIRRPLPPASNPMLPSPSEYTDQMDHLVNGANGTDEKTDDSDFVEYDAALADAASNGVDALKAAWVGIPATVKPMLKAALDRRHKPAAEQADAEKAAAE